MKKYFVVLCLFLVTGCTVEYHLDIDEELNFKEKTNLISVTSLDANKIKEFTYNIPVDIEIDELGAFEKKVKGISYYDVKKNNNNDLLSLEHKFDINSINNSYVVRSCYEYVTVMTRNDDKELLLSTSNKLLCFKQYDNLDEVKIVISSIYKLKETNADSIDGHNYIWNVNKDNYSNKYIYLLLDVTETDLTFWEKVLRGEYTNICVVSVLIFVVCLLGYFILKGISKKRDEI